MLSLENRYPHIGVKTQLDIILRTFNPRNKMRKKKYEFPREVLDNPHSRGVVYIPVFT